MLEDLKLAVIGLGYVSLPLAVEFGTKRVVVGYDVKPTRIATLQQGKDETLEVAACEYRTRIGAGLHVERKLS